MLKLTVVNSVIYCQHLSYQTSMLGWSWFPDKCASNFETTFPITFYTEASPSPPSLSLFVYSSYCSFSPFLALVLTGSWILNPCGLLGGWFLLSNCMAQTRNSSPISEAFSNSHPFFQFLTFLFIVLLLFNFSHIPNPSAMASSEPVKSSESTTSTTNLHPQKTKNPRSSSKDAGREFGAKAHEVPSGPNPIQNR
ncbi:CLAVATA3/ESR (CLE)-related protein TDIF [Spatholobus suberectus]|nr:CLAVATA3/ESR (CLE)-related protein TDIF [Spatholobus suberectus]